MIRDRSNRRTESEMTMQPLATANELAGQRTDLAVRRTVMAADRSLMAWIRTGLSLISFGFTIYKLLQEAERLTQVHEALRSQSPRDLRVDFRSS
jgi:uncharacterized membrane protein YidH (DUF202 family)